MPTMDESMFYSLEVIGHYRGPFQEKFGIPRQSGLAKSVRGEMHFSPNYQSMEYIKGIEKFSHLWLLWILHAKKGKDKREKASVRPPRLAGNDSVGVFASRAPYRPNPIAMSLVRLEGIEERKEGPVLLLSGADLLDNSPIVDIKPYLPYADIEPSALAMDFAEAPKQKEVIWPAEGPLLPASLKAEVEEVLSYDPRPAYHKDERSYGMRYAAYNLRFHCKEQKIFVESWERVDER